MKWETYKLKQLVKTQKSVGKWIESWEDIQDIDIMVSNNLYTNVVNDAVYRVYAPVAVAKFKGLEKEATYMLANDVNAYEVTSFNISGRYSQLLLKEVVISE
ncbi:MAG: hypothetical protein J6F30_08185 [Cellulosilyticum sp.]|nr:hypothetical protein [Cellulosilyticum sp.]